MSHEVKIHDAQTTILRDLLFKVDARYSDLRKSVNMDSDHFKFHINRLVDAEFIEKNDLGRYNLTPRGKEYANKIDTDRGVIERQPKSAVIVIVQHGDTVLVQERRKHPYFGFWGYPSGKIRWGETIIDTAHRELMEETNLTATLRYCGVYHERVQSAETGEMLEDKIFHVIAGHSPDGVIKDSFEGGVNAWMPLKRFSAIKKKYASCDIETEIGIGNATFIERVQTYKKDEF